MDAGLVEYLLSAVPAGLTLLLVLSRRLITKQEHDRALRQIEKLQKTADSLTDANATLREANRNLASSGHLTNEVMTALLTLASQRSSASAIPPNTPPAIPSHPENT